ncbi:16S rRNA (cytosine(1402)-N(4))-methyltransferase RsmH [Occultella gossypii]|uniref:Ribosomal RNA small subunit methyltransferase H n=1 Tax=Occultella gossypii TaxID=2800820 RepID=A0ABS7SFW0_9MICO|nr:16S rRNA (cytosine(1402)-N(4))-methyltransferase RsmH [Occultella gossypii]MBZ2199245.1 16S rRNA (cytosine(1402)-N(4))-methyltransferase RsmH [Occultella gossypii]
MSSEDIDGRHIPVLADRCVELLGPALAEPGAVYVDGTLGLGGHSELVLTRFPHVRVIGIDRDPAALALAGARLAPFSDRFTPVHAVHDSIGDVVAAHTETGRVQGILLDLGVSSMQLDEPERGFAYAQDAPLDMRMDQTTGRTAAELLASESEHELRTILYRYGDEKFAPRIARAIIARRESDPVTRSGQLVDLVRDNIPQAARRTGGNPAKRTFQALRIAVNAELEVLERAIPAAVATLAVGGRIVVMSFQSLEDRIVKRALARGATSSTPPGLPVELSEHEPYLRLLTRGAEEADAAEQARNPRSASVRLRAAERLRPTPTHLEAHS